MSFTDVLGRPLVAAPDEVPSIQSIRDALSTDGGAEATWYFLTDSTGKSIALPNAMFQVLKAVAHELAAGHSITILNFDDALTTQQAANLLQVSRPYLVQELKEGKMPYSMVGTHRRVRLGDVLAYKERRDQQRKEALEELRRASDELALYDTDPDGTAKRPTPPSPTPPHSSA